MDAVSDYLLSLPGGLLNPTYTLDGATRFIMDHSDAYLKKMFTHYTPEFIKGAIHFFVSLAGELSLVMPNLTTVYFDSVRRSIHCRRFAITLRRR